MLVMRVGWLLLGSAKRMCLLFLYFGVGVKYAVASFRFSTTRSNMSHMWCAESIATRNRARDEIARTPTRRVLAKLIRTLVPSHFVLSSRLQNLIMSTYDPSLLTVVRANEEQQRRAHHNTFPQWGQPGGLSEEDWENARVALGEGIWAQEDAVVSWYVN